VARAEQSGAPAVAPVCRDAFRQNIDGAVRDPGDAVLEKDSPTATLIGGDLHHQF
jgi:hypothetical protein